MPKALHNLATKLMKQGKSESSAWAIATAAFQKSGKLPKKKSKKARKNK